MTPADREHYATNGYVVLRGVVDDATFAPLELAFTECEHQFSEQPMYSAGMARFLGMSPTKQRALYEAMRDRPELANFDSEKNTLRWIVRDLTDTPVYRVAMRAPRFRMDLPHDTRYLAVWHQDHAYVGGSTDTVTAWVPLQDTPWEMGPLLVSPDRTLIERVHSPGPNGRKVCWPGNRNIVGVPMRRGDVLLFHSLLLHSGQVNLSDRVRYSIQVRYEPL